MEKFFSWLLTKTDLFSKAEILTGLLLVFGLCMYHPTKMKALGKNRTSPPLFLMTFSRFPILKTEASELIFVIVRIRFTDSKCTA